MSVLGGILLENQALNRALEFLLPEDFYREGHGRIFDGIIDLSFGVEPLEDFIAEQFFSLRSNMKSKNTKTMSPSES